MATALARILSVSCRRMVITTAGMLVILLCASVPITALAGDSLYGRVSEVKSADHVTVDIGTGLIEIRLAGLDVPREDRRAEDARKFVSDLLLGKNARLRLDYRGKNKEMIGRLETDDPEIGIKDVGVELVRAGLVRRQPNYDYRYRELSAAENEAQRAGRGIWSETVKPQPKK